jgi:hypothetical protein
MNSNSSKLLGLKTGKNSGDPNMIEKKGKPGRVVSW